MLSATVVAILFASICHSHAARVFIIGGSQSHPEDSDVVHMDLQSAEVIDVGTDGFNESSFGTALPEGRFEFGAASLVGFVYVVGGRIGSSTTATMLRLDTTQQSWESQPPMPTARRQLAVAASSTTLYAVGGGNLCDPGCVRYNVLEAFSSTTGSWATLAPMQTAREGLAAAVVGNSLYAVGGWFESPLNSVEKYNIQSGEWSSVAPMEVARSTPCVAELGGKLYAIGGTLQSAEVYDPTSNTWSRIADMSVARSSCGAAAVHGLIYVFGGRSGIGRYLDSVEVYNPQTDTWRVLSAKMRVRRFDFGIATVTGS